MTLASDLSESRATVATLQLALNAANERIRELQATNAMVNLRLTAANDRCDELESAVWRLKAALIDAGAAQTGKGISP